MDPEITLSAATIAARDGDANEVVSKLSDLCVWLANGGAVPKNLAQRLAAINDFLDAAHGAQEY